MRHVPIFAPSNARAGCGAATNVLLNRTNAATAPCSASSGGAKAPNELLDGDTWL